ncbi:iron-sulfur cluster repair di-iron protein [Paracoccus sp. (in: a-proteobacteria)]|uniref:iron-sulfur cluster repair di-iron protein n=1 Tax=Paracoccus sp. TaxID=267 RepID=UPI003220415B
MTTLEITLETPVGAVTDILPGSTEVFRRAGIGFCCGGNESIATAAAHNGVDPAPLMAELQALVARSTNIPPSGTEALIDHILARFHEVHREELEWLIPLSQKVETVHGDHEEAPEGLTAALVALANELDSHMSKEEQVLFPMMRAGGNPMIVHPIAAMRGEHEETDALMTQVMAVTRNLELPVGACRSWTALYTGLRKFADDLTAHIALENDVLFPRFEAA